MAPPMVPSHIMASYAAAVVLWALSGSASRNISSATFAFALSFFRPLISIAEDPSCEFDCDEVTVSLIGEGCIDHFIKRSNEVKLES